VSFLRLLSTVALVLALGAAGGLLFLDLLHRFKDNPTHQQVSAVALMLIGSSYVSIHLAGRLNRSARIKAVLLGGAFFLWGVEQFLPPGPLITAIDCAVILIFVVDLSLSVITRLKARDETEG